MGAFFHAFYAQLYSEKQPCILYAVPMWCPVLFRCSSEAHWSEEGMIWTGLACRETEHGSSTLGCKRCLVISMYRCRGFFCFSAAIGALLLYIDHLCDRLQCRCSVTLWPKVPCCVFAGTLLRKIDFSGVNSHPEHVAIRIFGCTKSEFRPTVNCYYITEQCVFSGVKAAWLLR